MTGIEAFWEECDRNDIGDDPLMRELCYRLDAIQRLRGMITDAEDLGDDEALDILSSQFERQHEVVRQLRQQIGRATLKP